MKSNVLVKNSPIIVALDYPTADAALAMASSLDPEHCRVKVGKELFTRCGPTILEGLHKQGFEVFLDLKFHDIPNTTANAVAVAADLGVWMVNVHASGGRRMMDACVEKLSTFKQKPMLIGVTVLTSMQSEDLVELGLAVSPLEQVTRLAALTKACGLDGVVCSSHEVTDLKARFGKDFKLVTPGIRPTFSVKGDQRRVMTPREAVEAGSDYLVIGRPITQAEDPLKALALIRQELS
ncbi:MAG: orotidine-5'-phosphate decarboxylase [Pseudohongiellaceae bacterium]|jgi:orotidine-5'-phosphate decarboxylase